MTEWKITIEEIIKPESEDEGEYSKMIYRQIVTAISIPTIVDVVNRVNSHAIDMEMRKEMLSE